LKYLPLKFRGTEDTEAQCNPHISKHKLESSKVVAMQVGVDFQVFADWCLGLGIHWLHENGYLINSGQADLGLSEPVGYVKRNVTPELKKALEVELVEIKQTLRNLTKDLNHATAKLASHWSSYCENELYEKQRKLSGKLRKSESPLGKLRKIDPSHQSDPELMQVLTNAQTALEASDRLLQAHSEEQIRLCEASDRNTLKGAFECWDKPVYRYEANWRQSCIALAKKHPDWEESKRLLAKTQECTTEGSSHV
jgi:hypothetical protein